MFLALSFQKCQRHPFPVQLVSTVLLRSLWNTEQSHAFSFFPFFQGFCPQRITELKVATERKGKKERKKGKIWNDLKWPKHIQHSLFYHWLLYILPFRLGDVVKTREEKEHLPNSRLLDLKKHVIKATTPCRLYSVMLCTVFTAL